MSTQLAVWILLAMNHLAPGRDHEPVGRAVATVVEHSRPFFAGLHGQLQTAATVLAVFFRESTFDNGAIGDFGDSHCAGQIHLPWNGRTPEGWDGAALRADPMKCTTVTMRMLSASFRACRHLPPEERLGLYTRGKCESERGRALSRDRSWVARSLVQDVPLPLEALTDADGEPEATDWLPWTPVVLLGAPLARVGFGITHWGGVHPMTRF